MEKNNPNNIGYVIIETATTSDDVPESKNIRRRDDGRIEAEGVLLITLKENFFIIDIEELEKCISRIGIFL